MNNLLHSLLIVIEALFLALFVGGTIVAAMAMFGLSPGTLPPSLGAGLTMIITGAAGASLAHNAR